MSTIAYSESVPEYPFESRSLRGSGLSSVGNIPPEKDSKGRHGALSVTGLSSGSYRGVYRGRWAPERLAIHGHEFSGLAALFPQGLRPGSTLFLSGPRGGGALRVCLEFLAWWSRFRGFCVLVDLEGAVSPAAVAWSGAALSRLVVFRPSSRPTSRPSSRLASVLGALIDGFESVAVVSHAPDLEGRVLRKAVARTSARKAVTLFVCSAPESWPAAFGPSVKASIRCRAWKADQSGALLERLLEVRLAERGLPREVYLVEKADSSRLVSVGKEVLSSGYRSFAGTESGYDGQPGVVVHGGA